MKIVKLTHPLGWFKTGHWGYENHIPNNSKIWGEYQFEINNDINNCDFWVVHGNLDFTTSIKCPKRNTVLITSEEKSQVPYYEKSFLKQFGTVITSRDDIVHPNIIKTHYFCPWSIKKTYSELINIAIQPKRKTLSAIISNNQYKEGHRKRYAFTKKLKEHFKDQLTWYCKGESSFISDKWDGLASFQYSIAIENSSHLGYFTEKIMDCFLTNTMPIYYGCANITDFFPEKSMVIIDIENPEKSIQTIEKAIAENWAEKYQSELAIAKELVLNKYQFIAGLTNTLDQLDSDLPHKKTTIRPEAFFKQHPIKQYVKKIWSLSIAKHNELK